LRSLIQCVGECSEGNNDCDDLRAAVNGLADYAESIHLDLDPEDVVKRAMAAKEDRAA
jgi:hypothetical protein